MNNNGQTWWRLVLALCMMAGSPQTFSAIAKSALPGAATKPEYASPPASNQKDKHRPAAIVPSPSRTVLLYENHCTSCHESTIHIQNKRKAKNLAQIRKWVASRAEWLKLNWTEQEINDVADFLNKRYYKYKK